MPRRAGSLKVRKVLAGSLGPKRESACSRGYGYRWQKARFYFLKKYPLCVHCSAEGRTTVATDVDHKIPHKGCKKLFWESANWQSLCKSCHSRKTVLEDGGFGYG